MSPSALLPCPACNRHVRADEIRCPFCAAALPERSLDGGSGLPRKRLGRAALMTAGAILGAAEACGDTTPSQDASTNNDTGAASDTSGQDGGPVALYGAPAPEYGVPPPPPDYGVPPPAASSAAKTQGG